MSGLPVAHTCENLRNSFTRSYLKKLFTKIGLVEWFQVKALSSNPQYGKKRKRNSERICQTQGLIHAKQLFCL
jgi:hypothetical protein